MYCLWSWIWNLNRLSESHPIQWIEKGLSVIILIGSLVCNNHLIISLPYCFDFLVDFVIMDVSSDCDEGRCVKEEWSTLFKPKGAFDSAIGNYKCCLVEEKGESFSTGWVGASCGPGKHLEALQLCTEGLGFESSDETETDAPTLLQVSSIEQENTHNENKNRDKEEKENENENENRDEDKNENENESETPKRYERQAFCSKFPPPLPSIARNSQAGVFMKSFKKDGRFVLQEVKKHPSHEVLHAWRGDGRLKLHLIHKDDHPNAECQRI